MATPEFIELVKLAGYIIGPAGAAWLGVKHTLNGTVARVQRIEQKVDDLSDNMTGVRERLARLEG